MSFSVFLHNLVEHHLYIRPNHLGFLDIKYLTLMSRTVLCLTILSPGLDVKVLSLMSRKSSWFLALTSSKHRWVDLMTKRAMCTCTVGRWLIISRVKHNCWHISAQTRVTQWSNFMHKYEIFYEKGYQYMYYIIINYVSSIMFSYFLK